MGAALLGGHGTHGGGVGQGPTGLLTVTSSINVSPVPEELQQLAGPPMGEPEKHNAPSPWTSRNVPETVGEQDVTT
ncbi:MAG: hypothetical protein JSS02_17970 [Planctomycetes bacterium]|nr:hypothetical protein [Planctomycetota bacterium]